MLVMARFFVVVVPSLIDLIPFTILILVSSMFFQIVQKYGFLEKIGNKLTFYFCLVLCDEDMNLN